MTAPGLLDFFVLEASEYLEQLDGVLAGGSARPDLEALQRGARGLRGSATMAKLPAFAELAAAVERVARAAREGAVSWDQGVGGALVGAVDELKVLLHAARNWSDAETRRARSRSAELLGLLPRDAQRQSTSGAGTSVAYVSNETANVAAGLEFLLTAPGGGGDVGMQVLQRVRALRGIAAIRDVATLPDALEAAEQAATPLEQGRALSDAQREVLRIAAKLLRDLALAIRAGRALPAESLQALEQALDNWLDHEEGAGTPIVAIESLFHGDEGPHVVAEAPNPPTTATQRFQLETVSNGEHLRLLVEEARAADPAARGRYRRHIRRSLRAIRRTAESFGELAVADAVATIGNEVTAVDDATLERLATVARRLAAPGSSGEALATELQTPERQTLEQTPERPSERTSERLSEQTPELTSEQPSELPWLEPPSEPLSPELPWLEPPSELHPRPAAGAPTEFPSVAVPESVPKSVPESVPSFAVPESVPSFAVPESVPSFAVPESVPSVAVPPVRRPTPSGSELAALLGRSVSAVGTISAQPLAEPTALDDSPVVPVDALLYRGKAALHRALELRNEIREAGGAPDPAAIDELFDLIELALVD